MANNRGTENFRNQSEETKKYIDLEDRYQDALKVTSSMIGGLNRLV